MPARRMNWQVSSYKPEQPDYRFMNFEVVDRLRKHWKETPERPYEGLLKEFMGYVMRSAKEIEGILTTPEDLHIGWNSIWAHADNLPLRASDYIKAIRDGRKVIHERGGQRGIHCDCCNGEDKVFCYRGHQWTRGLTPMAKNSVEEQLKILEQPGLAWFGTRIEE